MVRSGLRLLLALFYAIAGIAHLRSPGGFVAITPDWVPYPAEVVAFTGVTELLGAAGLLVPRTLLPWARPAAGIGLALYALCVWPANFNHALNAIPLGGETLGWWYHGPRLAAQPLIIWLALWVGEVVDWPFKRKS
ncbi:MAG: DoxX family protein [Sphingorhabdus sp.]